VNVAGVADDAPTRQFVGATVGDRCPGCGTQLATDQKYCLNCGERRGKPRFAVGAAPAPAAAAPAAASRAPKKQRLSSSTALVAGVGTLLLAMGVGVLIGHTDNGSSKNASAPAQIITVGGSTGPTSTGAAAATTQGKAKAAKGKSSKKANANKSKSAGVNSKQAAKAQAAASKVLGSSKNLPPATVKQGQSGHGPGYTKGHFTGTFFGQ
jgi:predicted lipid-binding transport protein (Tim44 family)